LFKFRALCIFEPPFGA